MASRYIQVKFWNTHSAMISNPVSRRSNSSLKCHPWDPCLRRSRSKNKEVSEQEVASSIRECFISPDYTASNDPPVFPISVLFPSRAMMTSPGLKAPPEMAFSTAGTSTRRRTGSPDDITILARPSTCVRPWCQRITSAS